LIAIGGKDGIQTRHGTKTVRIPISNIPGGGDYTAQILVGSQNVPANVILDTGSSTLAIKHSVYKPTADKNLKGTKYAQDVAYGTGGWAGPVVVTSVSMGIAGNNVTLQSSPMAIADDQQPHNFGHADGILGLAYNALNNAYDLTPILQQRNINPALSYPWPFPIRNSSALLNQLGQSFESLQQVDIPPYFDEVEQNGITADRFSFYTLRSFPSAAGKDPVQNPLNKGVFVLGGGTAEPDLYTGDFVNVKVFADAWYNTNLKAVQVEGTPPVRIAPLSSTDRRRMLSNSIVDTGTNALFLAPDVLNAIGDGLNKLNPDFMKTIQAAAQSRDGIASSGLALDKWPGISFILTGDNNQEVKLTCVPATYWQVDTPREGQAVFQIIGNNERQSILGLPLMNNYYTVFDRTMDRTGIVRFAPIKQPN